MVVALLPFRRALPLTVTVLVRCFRRITKFLTRQFTALKVPSALDGEYVFLRGREGRRGGGRLIEQGL